MGGQRRELIRGDASGRLLDSDVGAVILLVIANQRSSGKDSQRDTAGGGLASDKAVPGLGTLADNVESVTGKSCQY